MGASTPPPSPRRPVDAVRDHARDGGPVGAQVEVLVPVEPRHTQVLTPQALGLITVLERTFAGRRAELLRARAQRRERLARGEETLDFRPDTAWIRAGTWQVAGAAPGLEDRRVEITGPPTPRTTVNALNSGAQVWMADFEDATAPTWANLVEGHLALLDAAAGRLDWTANGKRYVVGPDPATVVVRPRGWHLDEHHVRLGGRPVTAAFVDFAIHLVGAGRERPYFYLPKLENHEEARLWNDVFVLAQDHLGMARGTIRATVLIETVTAAFEMDEILYELREHCAGLNAGRWDYLFSIARTFGATLLPERSRLTMTVPFMRAYTELLVRTCHRRGAYAIGGMAAAVPGRDPAANAVALERVRADKKREAADGFDGSWVAHPALVGVCREVFDAALGQGCDQRHRLREDVRVSAHDLLDFASAAPDGQHGVDEKAVRSAVSVTVRYLDAWLGGRGAVAIDGLMEDAATAEIARCLVWQWVRHEIVARSRVEAILCEEVTGLEHGAAVLDLFVQTALGPRLPAFVTVPAYARYLVEADIRSVFGGSGPDLLPAA